MQRREHRSRPWFADASVDRDRSDSVVVVRRLAFAFDPTRTGDDVEMPRAVHSHRVSLANGESIFE